MDSSRDESQQRRRQDDDPYSAAPSPTDTHSNSLRPPSAATIRDEDQGHGYGQLGSLCLPDSQRSTDSIRRGSEVSSPEGQGTIYSPSVGELRIPPDRTLSRTVAPNSQPARSPAPTPQLRQPRPVRSKPGPRRQSSVQAPHRGSKFSVDDDPREVEADAAEQQRRREQYSTMRRNVSTGPGTLSRLQSFRTETVQEDDEHDDEHDDGTDNGNVGLRIDTGTMEGSLLIGPEDEVASNVEGNADDINNNNDEGTVDEEGMDSEDVAGDVVKGDSEDDGDISDAESFTLKDRQQAINATHPFGIRLWKPALYKKSRSVQKTAEGDIHSSPGGQVSTTLLLFNVAWTLLFGWWMALATVVGALVCLLFAAAFGGREYGRVLWGLAGYLFYPFGKFVRLEQDEAYLHEDRGEGRSISEYEQWQSGDLENGRLFFGPYDGRSRSIVGRSRRSIDSEPSETDSLLQHSRVLDDHRRRDYESRRTGATRTGGMAAHVAVDDDNSDEERTHKRRLFGRGQWTVGRVVFFIFFWSLIAPSLMVVSAVCWFLVFWIPMARVTMLLFSHLRRHPLALSFESDTLAARNVDAPYSSILLCTYRAVGPKYWKYTVDGTNVFLINLLAVVGFVVFDFLVLDGLLSLDNALTSPAFLFASGLLSIIPLAYFIGQAVASISAQSSMGLGAAVNAFFSTIVEVFLYCVALNQGKARLVEGSIIGSIFAGILFLPGLSMCFGAIKRKTQRFNAKSAGVTSTMLLFAVLSAFSPTLFYQIYGTHEVRCRDCVEDDGGAANSLVNAAGDCRRCYYTQTPALDDRFYLSAVRPFCYVNAIMLFLAYVIGLWFTLRTHAAVIWNTDADEKKQDDHGVVSMSSHRPSHHISAHHSLLQQQQQHYQQQQQQQHPMAESSGVDVRDSQMYKRILGHSLKQVGLQPDPDDFAAPQHCAGGSITTGPVQLPTNSGGLHVVPPKPATVTASSTAPPHHLVTIPGLSEADNQLLVREVAEISATAATFAARDAIRRRASGLAPTSTSRPPPSARTATYEEAGAPTCTGATAAATAAPPPPNDPDGNVGHDAPNWSRRKSAVILLGATVLYAIIAEILVDTVDVVLEGFKVDEKFLGITLFALVPNTTEFLNAISFAMNGNIALSMEIGSAYALQVCLLQIPALVLFSAFYVLPADVVDADPAAHTFSLLFPQWDTVSVILCVFLLSYMYGEGKSNYFKGSILLLSYVVILSGFFFSGFASVDGNYTANGRLDVLRNGQWVR